MSIEYLLTLNPPPNSISYHHPPLAQPSHMPYFIILDACTPVPTLNLCHDTYLNDWVWHQALLHSIVGMEIAN